MSVAISDAEAAAGTGGGVGGGGGNERGNGNGREERRIEEEIAEIKRYEVGLFLLWRGSLEGGLDGGGRIKGKGSGCGCGGR